MAESTKQKNTAFIAAFVVYGVMVCLILLGAAEHFNSNWFHGAGDEGMAWGLDWLVWLGMTFVVNVILISFSARKALFSLLYCGLAVTTLCLFSIRPYEYWGQSKIKIQCDNHSAYKIKRAALTLGGKWIVSLGPLNPSEGRGVTGYVPNNGRVDMVWEKPDGNLVKVPIQLWTGTIPKEQVFLVIEENTVRQKE